MSIGFEKLRPREMIELLLFYAIPMRDVSDRSRALLDRFGSVDRVLHATREELTGVSGIGEAAARWLIRVGEAMDAYTAEQARPHRRIECLSEALSHAKQLLDIWPCPCCGLLLTDFEDRLMMRVRLRDDLAWADRQGIRRILLKALAVDAKRAILILYRETPAITDYDKAGIAQLTRTLQSVGIQLTDCISIAREGYISYALEEGYRPPVIEESALTLREDPSAWTEQ